MEQLLRGGRLAVVLAVLCVATLAALAAAPKEQPAPASIVGVIELDAVTHGYKGWAKAQDLLGAYYKTHQGVLDTLEEKAMGLGKDEFTEYRQKTAGGVIVDKERVKVLEDKAKTVRDEFDALRVKKDPTADDTARLNALNTLFKEILADLNKERDGYDEQYNGKANAYTKVLLDQLDKTLAAVAAAKKLSIVVSKDIQVPDAATQRIRTERFVIWGGTNITDDVLAILNADYKDTLLDNAK